MTYHEHGGMLPSLSTMAVFPASQHHCFGQHQIILTAFNSII